MNNNKTIYKQQDAVSLKCLICGSSDFNTVFDKIVNEKKFSVMECKNCGLVFTHPQIQPEEFSTYYLDDYDPYKPFYGNIVSFIVNNAVYRGQWFKTKHLIGKKADVLEIGCGNGEFTKFLIGYTGWNVVGIEPGDKAADAARKAGLDVQTCSIEDYKTDKKFDLIVIRHVLEHLNDPLETLKSIKKLLKSNGRIYITLPNVDTIEKKIFGTDWFAWDVPRHMFHLSPRTMELLAEKAGMKVKKTSQTFLPNNIIESIRDKLTRKGKPGIAKFFKISNVALLVFFLPASVLMRVLKTSGRMSVILENEKEI